jgi:hypothetical protein
VDATVFADGKLSAANRAHGYGGVGLSVHLDWFGEVIVSGIAADVENIAAFGITFEVDEVDNAFGVHSGLGLNAVIRCGDEFDMLTGGEWCTKSKQQQGGSEGA